MFVSKISKFTTARVRCAPPLLEEECGRATYIVTTLLQYAVVLPFQQLVPKRFTSGGTGGSAILTASVAPAGYGYQWYKNDVLLSGETHQSISANTSGDTYCVVYTGACDSYESDPVTVLGPLPDRSTPWCDDVETGAISSDWVIANTIPAVVFDDYTPTNCAADNGTYTIGYLTRNGGAAQVNALISPYYDLSSFSQAELSFDLAYKYTYVNRKTWLDVSISTDCGASFISLYNKTHSVLSTAQPVSFEPTLDWFPDACDDWRTETINLDAYAGYDVVLKLEVTLEGSWGQNLFLDNICIDGSFNCIPPQPTISPEEVNLCSGETTTLTASAIPPVYSGYNHQWYKDGTLMNGETAQTLTTGAGGDYTVVITDGACTSLASSAATIALLQSEVLPYAQDFEGATFAPDKWYITNPDAATTWERITGLACNGAAAYVNNFSYNGGEGQRDYLAGPVFDLSDYSDATLTFDVSYVPYSASFADSLEVEVSTDCGTSFSSVYYAGGLTLATNNPPAYSTASWVPASCDDWRTETVDLTAYVGGEINLQFINISDYGNRLYLDNINLNGTINTGGCDHVSIIYEGTNSLPAITTASSYIQAGNYGAGDVEVLATQDVDFMAESHILLDPGFVVHEAGVFTAEIEDCPTSKAVPETVLMEMEEELTLSAYPNPFGNELFINYELPETAKAQLNLYDITGRQIKTLLPDGEQPAGSYKISFTPCNLPSGFYLCVLHANGQRKVIKVVRK